MSYRFYVEKVQIFGNNELPHIVVEELFRQGLKDTGDSFVFHATDPDGLLRAVEKATLKMINNFAKEDDDLARLSNKLFLNKRVILDEINGDPEMEKHILYWQAKWRFEELRFYTPLLFMKAVEKKCTFEKEKLVFKGRAKRLLVEWY